MSKPYQDLRPGITEPVIIMISRRQVESNDMASVVNELKILLASREDCWLYRGQVSLVVDGYEDDPRELVDIPEVRAFLRDFTVQWPYWAFFFNQVDDSIILLGSCVCGKSYPGGGTVEMDVDKIKQFLLDGFEGMNALFDKHGFPEAELESMSRGLIEVMEQAGLA
ncbi:MAG TPA: hypothetical protein DCP03_06795 [Polaromonas sp.]|nr:hypothetical protein [Polaromonas sp.]